MNCPSKRSWKLFLFCVLHTCSLVLLVCWKVSYVSLGVHTVIFRTEPIYTNTKLTKCPNQNLLVICVYCTCDGHFNQLRTPPVVQFNFTSVQSEVYRNPLFHYSLRRWAHERNTMPLQHCLLCYLCMEIAVKVHFFCLLFPSFAERKVLGHRVISSYASVGFNTLCVLPVSVWDKAYCCIICNSQTIDKSVSLHNVLPNTTHYTERSWYLTQM